MPINKLSHLIKIHPQNSTVAIKKTQNMQQHQKQRTMSSSSSSSSSFLLQSTTSSAFQFDEILWVTNVRRTLEEEQQDDHDDIPVSIFNIPHILMYWYPNCFIPQQVSIGPYHYWRPELHEMERYKLMAAKKTQKRLPTQNFHHLVDELIKLEPRIRASYHQYLNFNSETLGWMVALDTSFLLEFLRIYGPREEDSSWVGDAMVSSRMAHLLDYSKRKPAHNAILRDIMMLENQIPLFVLQKVVQMQCPSSKESSSSSSSISADQFLCLVLEGLCKDLSPFKIDHNLAEKIDLDKHYHLLDFLYNVIIPKVVDDETRIDISEEAMDRIVNPNETKKEKVACSSYTIRIVKMVWNIVSNLSLGHLLILKKVLQVLGFIFKFLKSIITNIPGIAGKQPMMSSFLESQDGTTTNASINQPPLVEEITIPSVTELTKSGIKFVATDSISNIHFDPTTLIFYLPVITLDENTEVIWRNLVAYEASNKSGPVVFTRYTELMIGIIDTEEDVRLLREQGIIFNHLKSDEEVAEKWNGICTSIKLTRVHFIDKVIENVNKSHESHWKVRIGKLLKKHVFVYWKFLTFIAAVVLLGLMGLQAFCSVYDCIKLFHIDFPS